ncbi:MAG: haloperoxidase [Solirubrobacterales bacterium]|nr:haloperoxidase [Solirubrobacterales bacterium]
MKRAVVALLLAVAVMAAALPATSRAVATGAHASSSTPNLVVEWNQFLLGIQATPGSQPATVQPTYELAIMHAAIYDAIVSIDHSAAPYLTTIHGPGRASLAAAADTAAHDTLVELYPGLQPSIDQEYAGLVAHVPSGHHKAKGIRIGALVARQILAQRANDGSSAPLIPFQPGTNPGDYQLTPPIFAQPVFTHWRFVKPFALRHADQYQPPPPPALTSPKYAAAVNEVKTLGAAQGSTRTPDQTQIGLFWNPPIWATWNRIAQSAALERHSTLSQAARTFAALNLTFADSVIAFYDAKYTYRLWRPVTAIRTADTDGNPDTAADPNWTPLSATAADPAYPGAHGTISAAGATVLAAIYGNDVPFTVTSPALPGIERPFVSFSEAAEEASVSRIYNGNHTRTDQVAGEDLGHDIADFVLQHDLLARHALAH